MKVTPISPGDAEAAAAERTRRQPSFSAASLAAEKASARAAALAEQMARVTADRMVWQAVKYGLTLTVTNLSTGGWVRWPCCRTGG